jgi:MinD-like ATPase involved in chromosome partitioning or flagellar assembly
MQTTVQREIKTVIITKNLEVSSHFASHEQISIIGHYDSVDSLQTSAVLKAADLLIIEADAPDDPSIGSCLDTVGGLAVKVIVLLSTSLENSKSMDTDVHKLSDAGESKVFAKPWNFVEILRYIRYTVNLHKDLPVESASLNEDPECNMKNVNGLENNSIRSFRMGSSWGEKDDKDDRSDHLKRSSNVITVANSKGGVGKTFLSVNLACEFARGGLNKVGLVDANLGSGDMALHLDMLNAATIIDMLPNIQDLNSSDIAEILPEHAKIPLKVLLGPSTPEMCEFVENSHIIQIVELMKKSFDTIIIDTASSSFNMTTFDMLEISDMILVVTTCDLASLQQAKMMINLMRRLSIDVEQKVRLIVNRLTPESAVSPGRIEEFLQMKIKGVIPEEANLVSQSILHGRPVIMDSRMEPFRQDMQKVFAALQIVDRQQNPYAVAPSRKSMVDNIRSILFERKDSYGRRT